MIVIYKHPDDLKPQTYAVDSELKALQDLVNGPIECITLQPNRLVALVNEEGILRGLPYNCKLLGLPIYGPLILCGVDGEDFADIPEEYADPKIWRLK